MGIFDRFPYSSTHEMNLDFMLGKATEIAESLQEIDTHKDQAEQAATNAAQSAQSAAQAAQAAAGSKTAAGTSASQAAQHMTDAEDAADRAEAASDLADGAVEQAQTAAQNASTAATAASASATAADQHKTDANDAADRAEAAWNGADDSAAAATASAAAAAASAAAAAASAAAATKDYVTPEMFGAAGDGITDDSAAIQAAINSGRAVELIADHEYMFNTTLDVTNPLIFDGHYAKMKYTGTGIGINFNAASLPSHKRDFGFITHLFLSAPTAEKAINFKQAIKTVFDGIKIYDFSQYGFYIESQGYETYITNVWLVARKSNQYTSYGFYGNMSDMVFGNLFGLNVRHFIEINGGGFNINFIHAWCANSSILDGEPTMTDEEYATWYANTALLSFMSDSGQTWPNHIGFVYADTYNTAIFWNSYNRYNNIGFLIVRKCTNFFEYAQGKTAYTQYLSIDNCFIDPAFVSTLGFYPTIKSINGLKYAKAIEVNVGGDTVTCPENIITQYTKQFTASFEFVIKGVEQLPILLNDNTYGDIKKIRMPYKGTGSRNITASSGTAPADTYYATFFLRPEKLINEQSFKYVKMNALID